MASSLQETYDRIAAHYARDHASEVWGYDLIDQLLATLDLGFSVLDVGCGPGKECAYVAKQGFRAVGVDFAPCMVELARRSHPEAEFFLMNLEELQFPEGHFAGVIARSSLLHLQKKDLPAALKEIHRVLAPKGLLYVAVKEGDGEVVIEEADYGFPYRRPFSFFQPREMAAFLGQAGFEVRTEQHRRGGGASRLQFLAERRPGSV